VELGSCSACARGFEGTDSNRRIAVSAPWSRSARSWVCGSSSGAQCRLARPEQRGRRYRTGRRPARRHAAVDDRTSPRSGGHRSPQSRGDELVRRRARRGRYATPRSLAHAVALCSDSQPRHPRFAVGHALGRIGCFLVGVDYGRPSSLTVGRPVSSWLPAEERPRPSDAALRSWLSRWSGHRRLSGDGVSRWVIASFCPAI
jgi:hypothetical protein